jgi:hypothetical protein
VRDGPHIAVLLEAHVAAWLKSENAVAHIADLNRYFVYELTY